MTTKKETARAPARAGRDPFALLQEMTSDVDRMFAQRGWPSLRWPFRSTAPEAASWVPGIDVFEQDDRLITRVDLPGMKKEHVKVEVTDGHLAISGERRSETEEKKEHVYRCEREYGSFYRTVPLPAGVTLEDVKATFANGVLEVSVPLPAAPQAKVRKVDIQDGAAAAKTAA
jgi:HSP20 family protein